MGVERARANVKDLKLYVPNYMYFGIVMALFLFVSTYAFSSLVFNDFTSLIADSDLKVIKHY